MSVTRRDVLEQLAAESDAARGEMTTIAGLASSLDAEQNEVAEHVDRLDSCELACRGPDGSLRVTVTGEEFLELDTDDWAIVDLLSRNPDL